MTGRFGRGRRSWRPLIAGSCGLSSRAGGGAKSRVGAEWVIKQAMDSPPGTRITIAGRTIDDAHGIQVEGESGILAHSPPWFRPQWSSANSELRWPNGVMGLVFGAMRPDAFRGHQSHYGWVDEYCAWQYPECLDQMLLGLRLGKAPQCVITTTPRPIPALRELIAKPTTVTTKGATHDNLQNLAPTFAAEILSRYEGTRMGQQELYAEILDDSPTAMFRRSNIEFNRVAVAPRMLRIVVGVDPAGTNSAKSNHTGIVVCGVGVDRLYYVLEDGTMSAQPTEWAMKACSLYHKHKADRLVAETNMGGDMVETIIRVVDPTVAYKGVHASRGKQTRAEPIAALYEQNKVRHAGFFPQLEDELCTFDPMSADNGLKGASKSPDRCDALVWCLTELNLGKQPIKRMNIAGASPTRRDV
jgi:phage terminase large subunit-like protein